MTQMFAVDDLAEQILAKLNDRLIPIGARAIRSYIAVGTDIDRLPDGSPSPTAILETGQPGTAQSARNGAAITGARDSLRLFQFSTLLIAPDGRMLAQLYDQVSDALVGNIFDFCGEVREVQGVPATPVPKPYAPARYAMSAGFAMSIGA